MSDLTGVGIEPRVLEPIGMFLAAELAGQPVIFHTCFHRIHLENRVLFPTSPTNMMWRKELRLPFSWSMTTQKKMYQLWKMIIQK